MPNWGQVLNRINSYAMRAQSRAQAAIDIVRRGELARLQRLTKRNLIAYYSGWLSRPVHGTEINDEDKNGFMMCVHKMDRTLGLDLILHTPGGDIASTHSIVDYLQKMFNNDIRAIIPQIAMSSGTIIACCCRTILMTKHSNLGPIDPTLNGWPAYGVIKEFERACAEVKADPSKIPIWQSIISQYKPAFLDQCQNAIDWSNQFVKDQLASVTFSGDPKAGEKASAIVGKLSEYEQNKTHARHIHAEECTKMGLKVKMIEDDPKLQDAVLTVHHCFMHVFQNRPIYKAIENHLGAGIFKIQQQIPPPRN